MSEPLPDAETSSDRRSHFPPSAVWLLRCAVAAQAFGIGWKYLFAEYETDTPVRSVLHFEWGWSEAFAQRIDDVGVWLYLVSGLAVLAVPIVVWILGVQSKRWPLWILAQGVPLGLVFIGELLLAAAAWQRDEAVLASWSPWDSYPHVSVPLLLFGRASRVLLPLIVLLLTRPKHRNTSHQPSITIALWLMRCAASATFMAHGVECLLLSGEFVDFLLAGARDILGWDAEESTIHILLTVIGIVDVVAALLVLITRWRWVVLYMAVWALIAAGSRIIQFGWMSHFDVTMRSANYCLPLALGLYYRWCSSRRDD